MKSVLFSVLILASIQVLASDYYCASMPHAEEAVRLSLDLDAQNETAVALHGEDEYLAGGRYVMRKILIQVGPQSNQELVVSYSIVKSFDGPDHGGDYCDLTAIEQKSVVCARQPQLQLCR